MCAGNPRSYESRVRAPPDSPIPVGIAQKIGHRISLRSMRAPPDSPSERIKAKRSFAFGVSAGEIEFYEICSHWAKGFILGLLAQLARASP